MPMGESWRRMVPPYWRNETSGRLVPAIEAYLYGKPLTVEHVGAIRAYLRLWMAAGSWCSVDDDVILLTLMIDTLYTRADITRWLDKAIKIGIDPL